MKIGLFISLLLAMGLARPTWSQGFTIKGAELLDQNGQPFVMKGINMPLAWFVNDVNNNIATVKSKTGSNVFRIVMETGTADNAWQTAVNNCIKNKVIPIVELHNITGGTDGNRVNDMAKWWAGKKTFLTGANVAKYVLINIANEWGDWTMANTTTGKATWRDAYQTAITTIRNAGIKTTLVIDAPDWGQDLKNAGTLMAHAAELEEHDPEHNVLFSVHMYCEWGAGGGSSIATGLPAIKNAGIPIIVGEFGYQHTNGNGGTCDINETLILSTAEENGIGWLAWSWKGNGGDVTFLDLSSDWAGNNLSTWGNTIVNGANGTKTAKVATVFTDFIGISDRERKASHPRAARLRLGGPPDSAPGVNGRWTLDRRTKKITVWLE
jgi:mannan endo-1,4-beta-mannosidase